MLNLERLTPKQRIYIDKIAQQVGQAAKNESLSQASYQLIRWGNHIVFKNRQDKIVARVAPPNLSQAELNRDLGLCQQLAANGAPVLRPLVSQAVSLPDNNWVTFWPLGQPIKSLSGLTCGHLVRACQVAQPASGLSVWHPKISLDYRYRQLEIGSQAGLPIAIRKQIETILLTAVKPVEAAWRKYKSRMFFCHGDIYYGNIIRYQKELLLCDLDNMCLGPAEVDLSSVLVHYRNYCSDMKQWQLFLQAYNQPYDKNLCEALARLKLAGGLCGNASFWNKHDQRQAELMRCLKDPDNPEIQLTDF